MWTLWTASGGLPLTLSGQLIVFETLFALLYAFIYDERLPRPLELAAILLLVAGVCWSVRQHAVHESLAGLAGVAGRVRAPAALAKIEESRP